jgi:hypothetical protein
MNEATHAKHGPAATGRAASRLGSAPAQRQPMTSKQDFTDEEWPGSGAPLAAAGRRTPRDPMQMLLDPVDRLPGGGEGAAKVEQELLKLAQLRSVGPGQRTARRRRLGHLVCPHSVPCQRAGGAGGMDRSCTRQQILAPRPAPDGRDTAGSGCRGYASRQMRPADAVLTRFG